MAKGSKALVYVFSKHEILSKIKRQIMARLKNRLDLQEVASEDACDVIIALVPIVSRSGTDIEAALQSIPTTRPVVLMVFHHTFDVGYTAPQSTFCVKRNGVFTADFLFHEDVGLHQCETNDKALKSVTDILISGSPSSPLIPVSPQPHRRCHRRYCICVTCVCVLSIVFLVILVYFVCKSQDNSIVLTTMMPNVSVTTQRPTTANITAATLQPNITG